MSDDQLEQRLSQMIDASRERAREELPAFMEERVRARLRSQVKQPRAPRWWLVFATGLLTAAVVAGALTFVVKAPHVIVVDRVGSAAFVRLPLSRVTVLEDSAARIDEATPKRVHIALWRGSLVAEVEPGHRERAFAVTLPHGEIIVTGTIFSVSAAADHSELAVERGHVIVRRGDEDTSVAAGEAVSIRASGMEKRKLTPAEAATMVAGLERATWARDHVAPALAPDTPPTVAPVPRMPAPRQRPTKAEPAAALAPVAREVAPDVIALLAAHDCNSARAALDAGARVDDPSHAWFELAQCFNQAGDLASALATHRDLVRRFPSAAVSENAAYEIARLSRDLHRNDDAESAFIDYVARYPKGALTSEAYFWSCHMAATNQHIDRALSCLRAFRDRYPKSPRVAETYFSEATLLRTSKNDCRGALQAYARYLQSPGEHREQAEQWSAWCESHPL
jgi:TolA-binding protein